MTLPSGDARATAPSMGRDMLFTLLTQVIVALGGLWLYRLLALKKGADGVAAYSLVKQVVFFTWPVAMLGLQTAIPRYVALVRDRPRASESYLLVATALTGIATAVLCALALVSPSTTASVLFGDADRSYLVLPLALTLAAMVADAVMYGYFRGRSEFRVANAVHVVGIAALPVALLLAAGGRSIETLIALMAVGLIACCAVVVGGPLLRGARSFEIAASVSAGRTLLNYGYRRVPGEIAGVVLFTIPLVLAAHFAPLDEVAYLTAGLYVLFMISIASQPVGLVFLPVLSRLCATDFDKARRYVADLATSALHIGIFITPQLVLFADVAIRAWLGPDFDQAGTIIAITVFPAGIYLLNVVLRSALDAAAVTAYNARNNLVSLAVAALAATVSLATDLAAPLNCIAWSLALGVASLGALTFLSVQRVYGLRLSEFSLPAAAALGCVTAAVAWAVDRSVIGDDDSIGALGLIAGLQLSLGVLYLAGLTRAGAAWPRQLRDRLPGRAGS